MKRLRLFCLLTTLAALSGCATIGTPTEFWRTIPGTWSDDLYTQFSPEQFAAYEPAGAFIDMKQPDIRLLEASVFYETNVRRAGLKRDPLRFSAKIRDAAQMQADDMVHNGFFSHVSPVPGRQNFGDRLTLAGHRYLGGGENITGLFAEHYKRVAYIFVVRQNHATTHLELGKIALNMWENSRGHWLNLTSPNWGCMGTGVAVDHAPSFSFVAVQVFAPDCE